MTDGVPETVPCPCGNGYADRRRETVSDPEPGQYRRKTIHHYRHAGCPFGGYIVTRARRTLGRGGPVFEPRRFGVETDTAAGAALATDGGSRR